MERKSQRSADRLGIKRHWQAGLLASTALSAVLGLPVAAQAQSISATATPQGGVVVGGSASITQAPGSTTIDQTSQRAAINFQSFDVGSAAKVQINQPNADSVQLDRVVGGNLSQINGQINSNGQVVLINQSGVVFGKGAEVNAENVVVSTSNIATSDFMAGKMVFSGGPNPGAKIINDGHITARNAGLVGLVAPQVANNGVITAKLGQVVLAGASAFTLDMYGDKLISLDVTKAVRAVDVGGELVPALVTNSGLILADGGKITLTAQDADALVTQLINAGGTIRANSLGGNTGTISIQGVGGDINIAGNLLASGQGGAHGGAIAALTTGTVAVASGAVLDASGDAGGGVIAIGTDMARARQGAADVSAPKSAAVVIAQGARLAADATGLGNGGTVTLLSAQNTAFDGAISLQGGAQGGNGGRAEISSDGVISLGGTVLAGAANGKAGQILLDPQTLVVAGAATTATISGTGPIVVGGFDTTVTSTILNTQLGSLTGTIILEAASLISVAAPVNSNSISALSLQSHGDVSVTASIDITGDIDLAAAGSLDVGAGLTAANIGLTSGLAGTDINAGVTAGSVMLGSTGAIYEGAAGSIIAAHLVSAGSIGGDVTLANANNITTLGSFTAGGNLTLANTGGLTVGGAVSAANISLSGASLTFESGVSATGLLALSSTGTIFQGAGTVSAGTLAGSADGEFALTRGANRIGTLGAVSAAGGDVSIVDTGSLTVAGSVSGRNVYISVPTLGLQGQIAASFGSAATLAVAANSISVAGGSFVVPQGRLEIAPLSAGTVVDIGMASSAGTLGLPGSVVAAFDSSAGLIEIGNGVIGAQARAISIDGSVSFASAPLVDLSTSGTIFDHSGTLTANVLAIDAGGVAQSQTAAFDVAVLQGGGGPVSGDVVLTGTANAIQTLESLKVAGTLNLVDTGTLGVAGPVGAGHVSLFAPAIALADGATLAADGAHPVLSLAGDTISAGVGAALLAPGGTVALASDTSGRAIAINGISDGNTLGLGADVFGAIGGDTATILIGNATAGNITIAPGTINFTPALDLSTGGSVFDFGTLAGGTILVDAANGFTQGLGGAIIAGLFGGDGGSIGGNVLLENAANTISSLGSFAGAIGTLSIIDTGALTIAGAIDPDMVTLSADTLVIGNDISVASLLALGSSGSISQIGGSITAPSLVSFGSIGGDATLAGAGNDIGTLGGFTLGGALNLVDGAALTLAGPVSGAAVSLRAAAIDLAGDVDAAGPVAFGGTGNVTQSSGAITAGTLVSLGSIGGTVVLNAANTIATLGGFTLGGNLALNDAASLDIAGIVATPGAVTLTGTSLSESTGALAIGTLTTGAGSFAGAVDLTGANSIATLGDFTLSGAQALTLNDASSLAIAGVVSLPDAGFDFSGAGLYETGAGAINAASFSTGGQMIAGDILLTGANHIGLLDDVAAAGTLAVYDAAALSLQNRITAQDILLAAPTLNLSTALASQVIAGPGGTLALAANEFGLGAAATTLDAPGGTIELAPDAPGLAIDIGNAAAVGTVGLAGSIVANIGADTAKILIGAGAIGTQASGIAIDQSVSFGGTSVVDLSSSGVISQNSGTVSAATLEFDSAGFTQSPGAAIEAATLAGDGGSIAGSVLLTGTNNMIGELTAMSLSTGTLAVYDAATLTVAGVVSAPIVTLAAVPGILLTGSLNAPTGLALGSEGDVSETGSLSTASLTSLGTIAGNADLAGSNSIASLGDFSTGGTLALADIGALNVAGSVAGGSVSLVAGGIDLGSDVTAVETLALGVNGTGSGTISQSGGAIAAGILTSLGTVSAASFASAANQVGTLAAFASAGDLLLNNATSLVIAGLVTAPGMLTLQDAAGISEASGGIIDAGSFGSGAGSIGGDLILGNANIIANLGDLKLASGTNFTLNDAATLSIAGMVMAPSASIAAASITIPGRITSSETLSLNGGSSIGLAGQIDAGTLKLASGGSVAETGAGLIHAGTLASGDGGIGGDLVLTGANSIATLGTLTADGNFVLANGGSLGMIGPVTAGAVTISDHGVITLGGALAGTLGQVTLLADGLLEAAGGTVAAPGGTIAIAPFTAGFGVAINGTQANALDLFSDVIAALDPTANIIRIGGAATGDITSEGKVVVSSPTLVLTTSGQVTQTGTLSGHEIDIAGTAIALNGTVGATTLALASAGSVSQGQAGVITAGSVRGIGVTGGNVNFAGTANAIGTLGHFNVNGDFAALDAGTLVVAGPIAAHNITLTENGAGAANSLAIDGTLSAGAAGMIALTADNMSAANAAISAPGGTVLLTVYDPGTAIDLGGTNGGLELSNALTGAIDPGTGLLKIITTGALRTDGDVTIRPASLLLSGDGISFNGNLNLPGASTLALASSNGITAASGETLTAGLLEGFGAITGPVALGQGLNYIGTLGGFSVTGAANDFALADALALTVGNPLTARNIALQAAGLTIANVISASSAITLGSSNGILETGAGALDAASLSGGLAGIAGDVSLSGVNNIGTLAGMSLSGGTLYLTDQGALNIAGQVAAGQITLVAGTIGLGGQVSAASVLALEALSGGVTQSSGFISAPTLTSNGATIGGDVALGGAANLIGTLGGFAATGGIILNDARSLAIAGIVATPGRLTLQGSGPIGEVAGGGIDAGTLGSGGTAIGGDVLLGNANSIAALGNLSLSAGHTLSLNDATGLMIAGTLVADDARLVAVSIAVPGGIISSGQLALGATGGVSETGSGVISAGTLISAGSIGGDVMLGDANLVGTLGAFVLGGTLDLVDAGLLTVAGPVSGTVVSLAAGTIDLAGDITAPEQIALGSTGTIMQSAGILTTNSLVSQNTIGGDVTLADANLVGTLGAFAMGGTLDLVDAGLLTVSGPVSGPVVSLAAGTIDLAGDITAPNQIALGSTGTITQSAGILTTNSLVSQNTIGGDVSLADANQIGTLGAFALGGTLDLVDAGLLTVAGPVSGSVVSLAAGTIDLAGDITAPEQIALGSTGTITQSAGILTTNSLVSQNTIGGDVSLADANQIGTLGAFVLGGTLDLVDAGLLTVAGPVFGPVVSFAAGTINLAGDITAPDQIALGSTGTITQSAGILTTNSLLSQNTIGGNVSLADANQIGTLGAFALGGTLDLVDAGLLTVAGPVSGKVVSLAAGTIDLAGDITAPDQIALGSTGTIMQSAGILTTNSLVSQSTIGGDVTLGDANLVGTLGAFALGGTLDLVDAGLLTIAGPVSGPVVSLAAGTIDLAGDITAPEQIALGSTGTITQSAGILTTNSLVSQNTIGGDVTLADANLVGTLGAFALGGTLDLVDAGLLTVAGPVSGPVVSLAAGTIDLAGDITAPNQIALGSTGTITQSAGILTTNSLVSQNTIGGDVSLGDANQIGTIGAFTLGGTLDLVDAGLLTVAGPVSGPVVSLAAGTIDLAGDITAPGQIALGSTGNITQTAGTLATNSLISQNTIGGDVTLVDANLVGTLGAFALGGTLDLVDAGLLTVAGPVFGPVVSLAAGTIDLAGDITAPDQIALGSTGTIMQIAGILTTNSLVSQNTIGGDVTLADANQIGTLGAFALGGTLDVVDAGLLTVAGPVSGKVVSLAAGTIDLAGDITAPNQIALGSTGTIMQSAGILTTNSLVSQSTIGGDVTLGDANLVGTLGAFALGGTLDVVDAGLLTVAGPVSGTVVSLAAGMIDLAGDITAPEQIALGSTGTIMQSAGILTTNSLVSQNTIGGDVTLADANLVGTLGAFALGGTLDLVDAGLLTVAGPVSGPVVSLAAGTIDLAGDITAPEQIALGSSGTIMQSAGILTTNSLVSQSTIGGDVSLADANLVGTLGAFALGGTLDLVDAGLLTVAGPVSGTVVSLAAGTIDLAGDIIAPDQIALGSTGAIMQSAGILMTNSLVSQNTIGGDVTLADANQIGTLGAFAAGGNLILGDADHLALTGPVNAANITLSAAGLAVNGLVATPGIFAIASTNGVTENAAGAVDAAFLTTGAATIAGDITLNSPANSIASLGSLAATGGLTLNDAIALNITAPVHLGGTLALGDAASITQTGGFISAAALTSDGGTIGGDVVLGQAGNAIPVLGNFAASGDVTLADAAALTLAGNVSTGNRLNLYAAGTLAQASGIIATNTLNAAASAITLTDANQIGALGAINSAGSLTVNGAASLTGPVTAASALITNAGDFTLAGNASIGGGFTLNAGGGIGQSGGTIAAQSVTLTGTSITLGGDINAASQLSIDPSGVFTQSGGHLSAPVVLISAGGDVLQNAGSLAAQTATLSGANIALAGDSSIAGTLDINATGSITHGSGSLYAGLFEGTAPQFASFGSVTDFGTLGSFIMQDSQFILNNSGSLTVIGPVVANSITINAAGQITLAGAANGGLYITGSIAPDHQTAPRPGDSVITSTAGQNGPASILQTGNFLVNSGPLATTYLGTSSQPATLFLYTGPSGTITLATYPDQLMAPSVDLVIGAGPAGMVTGHVDVAHLEILSALTTNLTGSIKNITGTPAAANGSVDPFPQPNFRFNTCPIGSVNCTILPIESIPLGNPLDNFDLKKRKRKKLDHNVQLPGIATRDY